MRDQKIPAAAPPSRRAFLAGTSGAALPASVFTPKALCAQAFPTADVNTTGLAVTDDAVTIGIVHSVTGTRAIPETGSIQAERGSPSRGSTPRATSSGARSRASRRTAPRTGPPSPRRHASCWSPTRSRT
jgi:hypothetical protein